MCSTHGLAELLACLQHRSHGRVVVFVHRRERRPQLLDAVDLAHEALHLLQPLLQVAVALVLARAGRGALR